MTVLTVAWRRAGMLMALVLLIIAASFLSDRFLTVPNLLNVLRQVAAMPYFDHGIARSMYYECRHMGGR